MTRRTATGDDGMTLIELIVTTSIMAIAMAMVTTGILQTYRSLNKDEAISSAQSQVNLAFQRLDAELRYAAGISAPATIGSDPYVEYLLTNSGTPTCTQLRLHIPSRQLQRRTWTQGASPLVPGPWLLLASGVTSGQPFRVLAADATYNYQRLELDLTAWAGGADTAASRQVHVTFTALNTSLGTTSATVCTEGRTIP